jgi:hypothetical protein
MVTQLANHPGGVPRDVGDVLVRASVQGAGEDVRLRGRQADPQRLPPCSSSGRGWIQSNDLTLE